MLPTAPFFELFDFRSGFIAAPEDLDPPERLPPEFGLPWAALGSVVVPFGLVGPVPLVAGFCCVAPLSGLARPGPPPPPLPPPAWAMADAVARAMQLAKMVVVIRFMLRAL